MNSLSRRELLGALSQRPPPRRSALRRPCPKGQRISSVRGSRRSQDPGSSVDNGVHHSQPRLPYLRHAVRTDEKLELKPQMVDRSSVSQDGMKYVFTLRDGLKCTNGSRSSPRTVSSPSSAGQEGPLRAGC